MVEAENGAASLSRVAYEKLRDEIVTLRRAPGEPLSEAALIRELGVGRTPIREALQRLACEGLVTIRPRRGSFVASLGLGDLQQIFEVRLELEGYAAALAAERATAQDIAAMQAALTPFVHSLETGIRNPNSPQAQIEIDREFHRALAHATHNKYLEQSLARLYNLNLRLWYLALNKLDSMEDALQQHVIVLQAIQARDGETAKAAMQKHIAEFQTRIRAVI